ncbi:MAG: hybrid sensor histidine kinase/response regulator [Verrucomicrobiae bacterium]|nr:hybrid sensor histidine kinase/response regulator [Verrucomicrobiae bacterium]
MTVALADNPPNHPNANSARFQSEFLAHITHELRTPVHAIIGYADLLTDGTYGPLNDDQRTTLSYLRQTANELLALVNNLLDVSRIESGRADLVLENFDVRDLLAEICRQLHPLADAKNLDLSVSVELPDPLIRTDRAKLKQILINLVGNAIKFTDHGQVTLRVTACAGGEVGFYTTRPHVSIAVRDTGCGIPPDQLHRLFEKFYRCETSAHRRQEGTGLGLFISKHLVELLAGKIDIVSEPGRGSTFTVTIPQNYESVEAIQRLRRHVEQAVPRQPVTGERQLLIVSHNPALTHIVQEALGASHYTVRVVSPDSSITAEVHKIRPLVVLLDAEEPTAACWAAFQALKAHPETRDIPTIFLCPSQSNVLGTALPVATSLNRQDLLRQVRAVSQAGRKRILVADDDPGFREVLRCALSSEGYQLDEASNGTEVIAKLDASRPDLLLLDLRMPDVDGWAVLRHIASRPELQDCRVLVITGDVLAPEESATLCAHTEGVLSKAEFTVQTMLDRVATTLEKCHHAKTAAH